MDLASSQTMIEFTLNFGQLLSIMLPSIQFESFYCYNFSLHKVVTLYSGIFFSSKLHFDSKNVLLHDNSKAGLFVCIQYVCKSLLACSTCQISRIVFVFLLPEVLFLTFLHTLSLHLPFYIGWS